MTKSNTIIVRPDGPLQCSGEIVVQDVNENMLLQDDEAWLCRCGASGDKPWCDGSHKSCGFSDPAHFQDQRAEPLDEAAALVFTVKPDAMLMFKGPVTIQSQNGEARTTRNRGALCRCGHSNNKPFCDASHKGCGFKG